MKTINSLLRGEMKEKEPGLIYDQFYYATGCGKPYERNEEWLAFFGGIAKRIQEEIAPHSVLDAGCAMGFLVEKLRELGIEAYGMDISPYAISMVHDTFKPFCSLGSITEPFPRKYDLIVSIEVLEHLTPQEAEKAVANFCCFTDDILFSSSPYDFREVTHLNVRPVEYWAELFARHGFYRDLDFDASFLTPWAVRFRRSREPIHRIVRQYERVMQRLVEENIALRAVNLEQKEGLALLKSEIEAIRGGITFQVAHKLRSVAPIGSRREKMLIGILGLLGIFRKEQSNH